MKIAGYVRQTPGRTDPDTAFAQSERIRRWTLDTANELIAICQDHHAATAPMDRPGFKALLEIARSGRTDAIVVANLSALSPDKMTQEVMIQDLREAGTTVIATDDADIESLRTAETDHTRMLVRDVLSRVDEYRRAFGLSGETLPQDGPSSVTPIAPGLHEGAKESTTKAQETDGTVPETTDVVVELIVPGA